MTLICLLDVLHGYDINLKFHWTKMFSRLQFHQIKCNFYVKTIVYCSQFLKAVANHQAVFVKFACKKKREQKMQLLKKDGSHKKK